MLPIVNPCVGLLGGMLALLLGACGGDQTDVDDPDGGPVHLKPGEKFSPRPATFIGVGPPSGNLQYPVVGDFDGDGKLDLAGYLPQNLYLAQVSTTLGNGDGTFGPRSFGGYDFENWSLFAVADFNRDGKTDLVAAGGDHGLGAPFLRSGLSDGSRFVPATQATGWGAYAGALLAADIDGDRLPDLLAYRAETTPYNFKGDGTGRFAIPFMVGMPSVKPIQALAADLDGDGTVDMLAACDMTTLRLDAKGISITVTLDAVPQAMASADFDRDGVADIALVMTPPGGTDSEVRILLGRGRFTVDPRLVIKLGQGRTVQQLVTGDWNGDGLADLAVAIADSRATGILLGMGDGTFAAARYYEGIAERFGLVAGDWNRDGKTDLVLGGGLQALLADGRGGLVAARTYRTAYDVRSTRAADLNRDGKTDLVLIGQDVSNTMRVSTLLNQGADSFTETAVVNLGSGSTFAGAVTGDFNRDGNPDAVVATIKLGTAGGALQVLLGQGDGTFATPVTLPAAAFAYGLMTADLNKDGHLDLLSANADSSDVAIFLGKGDGTFSAAARYSAGYGATSPQVADVDRDGKLDVVVLNLDPSYSNRYDMFTVLRGVGDGTVGPPLAVDLFSGYKTMQLDGFTMNDWDRDGNVDLAVCATGVVAAGPPTGNFQGLLTLRGDGRGGFVRGPLSALPDGCPSQSGDINGDGEADLVGLWARGRSVMLSQGDGSFTAPAHFFSVTSGWGGVLADMNGDRKLDIVEITGRAVAVRLNATP